MLQPDAPLAVVTVTIGPIPSEWRVHSSSSSR